MFLSFPIFHIPSGLLYSRSFFGCVWLSQFQLYIYIRHNSPFSVYWIGQYIPLRIFLPKIRNLKYCILFAHSLSYRMEINCRPKEGVIMKSSILFFRLTTNNLKIKNIYKTVLVRCAIWLWNMVSYIKGGMQPEYEANFFWLKMINPEGGEGFKIRKFIVRTVHLIKSGWLNL